MAFATAITALAVGSSLIGTGLSVAGAQQVAGASKNIAALEMQAEEQRRKAMELEARRRMLETIRMQQRARAVALNNATSQGAQFGSGLQGGYGQIGGQTATNMLGLFQNLEIGRNIFGINSQISQQKMSLAEGQGLQAFGAGLSGFGSSMFQATPYINSLTGGSNYGYGGYSIYRR